MWGKTLAFVILFILAFGILVQWIPDEFLSGDESIQDSEALTALTASNLIVYSASGADNMTFPYASMTDGPDPPNWNVSLPNDEYLEVNWRNYGITTTRVIELRHLNTLWWGGYGLIDSCDFYYLDGSKCFSFGGAESHYLLKEHLETAWSDVTNTSAFTASCDHISVSITFKPDGGYTDIGESFDAGYLWYGFSYEWNPEDTGFNVMALIVKLATFQGIGVGVPGAFGSFIDSLVSTLFYICIAIVAYVVITSLIPFISGAPDT